MLVGRSSGLSANRQPSHARRHSGVEAMLALEDLQQRVCSGFTPDSLFTGITGTKSTAKVNQKVKNAKGKSKKMS